MTHSGLDGDFEGTFPFEPRYVDAGDVRLHYVDEGPSDAPPLLFVHGNPTWSYLWRRPLAELSAQGRRCVAFDHMGFGRSDKPPLLARYTLQGAHRQRARADRRARPSGRGARGPRLGRPDRPRRDARAPRPAARPRADEHLGVGAAELRPALRARVPDRGPRRDPRARGQPVRRVDPRRHGEARHRPGDDGRLPRALPRLLVARRHARLPARHPAHGARPQRPADGHDPRARCSGSTSRSR